MSPDVSVIIPTHNPAVGRLQRTLQGLGRQTLPRDRWELLVIDNASAQPVDAALATSGHPAARVIREEKLGLTHARLAGISAATGRVLIMVDDDNVLREDYLALALRFLEEHSTVDVVGGLIRGEFETPPAAWSTPHLWSLALRDFGPGTRISDFAPEGERHAWPVFAPVGAGMVLRMEAVHRYVKFFGQATSALSDRKGTSLGSAGDCEMVMHAALLAGRQVAYTADLQLTHLIPSGRLTFRYLARLAYQSGISWGAFQVVYGFRTRIHPLTLLLRLPRAFLRQAAWTRAGYVAWAGIAGEFVGRAQR